MPTPEQIARIANQLSVPSTKSGKFSIGDPDAYSAFSPASGVPYRIWQASQFPPLMQAIDHLYGHGVAKKLVDDAANRRLSSDMFPSIGKILDSATSLVQQRDRSVQSPTDEEFVRMQGSGL